MRASAECSIRHKATCTAASDAYSYMHTRGPVLSAAKGKLSADNRIHAGSRLEQDLSVPATDEAEVRGTVTHPFVECLLNAL